MEERSHRSSPRPSHAACSLSRKPAGSSRTRKRARPLDHCRPCSRTLCPRAVLQRGSCGSGCCCGSQSSCRGARRRLAARQQSSAPLLLLPWKIPRSSPRRSSGSAALAARSASLFCQCRLTASCALHSAGSPHTGCIVWRTSPRPEPTPSKKLSSSQRVPCPLASWPSRAS